MEENQQDSNVAPAETSAVNKLNSQQQIAGAIIVAGLIIAGAILLKGNMAAPYALPSNNLNNAVAANLPPISKEDRVQGQTSAKVAVIEYADFQCPFCGAVSGLEPNSSIMQSMKQRDPSWTPFAQVVDQYVNSGKVVFVYRDFAFLGPESNASAEAARCAGDQGKFWEYHDYLYGHQNGENKGAFSNPNLKNFASILGLNTTAFNSCLDGGTHKQDVLNSTSGGRAGGVSGTPKGFILRNGKVVATIDGAESGVSVKAKIDAALQ